MKRTAFFLKASTLIAISLSVSGCVRALLPTSAEEFETYSYKAPPTNISTDFITAYANLKNMHIKCLNKNLGHTDFTPDSQINREKGSGSIKLLGSHGTILHIITVNKIDNKQSRLIVSLAKNKMIDRKVSDQDLSERVKNFKDWAEGTNNSCQ